MLCDAIPYSTVQHMYTAVSLTPAARDALRDASLEFTSPTGRRITLSQALIAALSVALRHRQEFIDELVTATENQQPTLRKDTP